MKLKIGAKVNILILSTVILVGGVSIFLAILSLKSGGDSAIDKYSTAVMDEKRWQIKDLVNAAYAIADQRLKDSLDKEKIKKQYGDMVKSEIEQAFSVFEASNANDALGDEDAKKAYAVSVIEKMRWGLGNNEYFWIQDTDGNMVMHPIKPSLNGKALFGIKDPDGKTLFKEMDDRVKESGGGFVDYKWPKPGHDEPVDKISYVQLFEPWGWIIGTGIYLESAEELYKQNALNNIRAIRYGKDNTGYFFIYDSKANCILLPPKPQNEGKNYYDLKDKKGNFILRDFIKAANENDQGGYSVYYYPKPGSEEPLPKLSYLKRLKEWDWIIGTGVYTDDVDQAIAQETATIKSTISQAIIQLLSIAVIIAVIALVAAYFIISKGVVGPIRKIIDMLRDIAEGEGDLTKRIEDNSGDETQELAEWFNLFVDNMQTMIRNIKSDAVTLNDSSSILANVSDQMNSTVQETSERANTVAASSEEMSANMNSIAAAMEEAATNLNMVSAAAEEMSSTITEIAKNSEEARTITNDAVSRTEAASSQVNELGTSADEISKVVETITDISEQVNLLALNATIEAARAGEAGKGFAVVANEIKDLANQTAEASNEIKAKIEGIQASTNGTVEQISSISGIVTQINDIVNTIATAVEEQSVTTREIAQNVTQASTGVGEVNENVNQGSVAAQGISQDIAKVTESSGQMSESSLEVKDKADGMSDLAARLSQMMDKFKV